MVGRRRNRDPYHGHEAGDDLLRGVAQAMRQSVRPSDLTARLGGDEFAVFLPELGAEEAAAAPERLRAAVAEAARTATEVTASVGGVMFPEAPIGVEALVQRADALRYVAKSQGRNLVSHEVVGAVPVSDPSQLPPAG